MRNRLSILWVVVALAAQTAAQRALAAAGAEGAPLRLRSSVDRDKMAIGDTLKYSLTLDWRKDIETPLPQPGLRLGEFEIVGVTSGDVKDTPENRKTQTHVFELSTFDTGEFEIPPFEVAYHSTDAVTSGAIKTTPIEIAVSGVAAADTGTDIRDLKPPAFIPPDNTTRNILIAAAVALALLTAGLVWHVRARAARRRALAVAPPEPPRPPAEAALEELEALRAGIPETNEGMTAFYVKLSEVIRVFLSRRFGFAAMDETTTEIESNLRNVLSGNGSAEKIGGFLAACDLVKFAKYPATRELALRAIEEAGVIVAGNR